MMTVPVFDSGFLIPITKVSTTMPITSSIMAAATTVVPTLLLRYPNSFKVSTVMLTEVAVIITPIKSDATNWGSPMGLKP